VWIVRLLLVLILAGLVVRAVRWLQAPRGAGREGGPDRIHAGRPGASASDRRGEGGARQGEPMVRPDEVIDVPYEELPPGESPPPEGRERPPHERPRRKG